MKHACVEVVGGTQGSWHAPQFAPIKVSPSRVVVKMSIRVFSEQINGSFSCEREITTRRSDEAKEWKGLFTT